MCALPCCPPNAYKFLEPDYAFVGQTHRLDNGQEFYHSGKVGEKGVLVIPDVFGWNGGRTRNIADFLGDEGYYTVVPKLLVPAMEGAVDGDGFSQNISMGEAVEALKRFPTEDLLPRIKVVVDHMKSEGVKQIAILAFCWGGWVAAHVLASDEADNYSCCAIAHPSLKIEAGIFGGDILSLVSAVRKPMLWLPTRGDEAEYDVGGAWFKKLKENHPTSESISFGDVDHGFIPRGNISDPLVKQEIDRALAATLTFFSHHMSSIMM
eukprot:gene7139-7892_t